MLALAAQPTEKGAHEQLRIDPVGLGAPMLTRNRDAARMDDVGLDLPLPQPTRQPKAVPASLEGNDDPADRLANFYRLIAPTVQKVQKRIFIRLQLLQRIPGDAGYQPGNNPPLQTQFDYGHKSAILVKGDEGPTEIVLTQGGHLSVGFESSDGAIPSSPAP